MARVAILLAYAIAAFAGIADVATTFGSAAAGIADDLTSKTIVARLAVLIAFSRAAFGIGRASRRGERAARTLATRDAERAFETKKLALRHARTTFAERRIAQFARGTAIRGLPALFDPAPVGHAIARAALRTCGANLSNGFAATNRLAKE